MGKRSLRRPEPTKKPERRCAECGCDTTDYYTIDPETGREYYDRRHRVKMDKVWCADCYERESRRNRLELPSENVFCFVGNHDRYWKRKHIPLDSLE